MPHHHHPLIPIVALSLFCDRIKPMMAQETDQNLFLNVSECFPGVFHIVKYHRFDALWDWNESKMYPEEHQFCPLFNSTMY